MARPKIKIDEKLLANLAQIHCTYEEMEMIMGVNLWTLRKRYSKFIEKHRAMGKMSIRRAQFKKALEDMDSNMLRWLGMQELGQKSGPAFSLNQNNVVVNKKEDDQKEIEKDLTEIRGLLVERSKDFETTIEAQLGEPTKNIERD